ncbi:MAG: NUDIX domain-containing protein [Pseudobutyrivibrio sp.]|nr:NUDIX domain-containing protein [Pseudobutyrivibrio sp.]
MLEETFDIVDKEGNPTGEVVTRKQAHAEGICHRTAHVWIVRDNEDCMADVLLQKRADNKDSFPGKYDTSSAGHILAGDEPLDSAIRELAEELGIEAKPSDLTFIGTFPIQYEKEFHGEMFRDNEIAFVYVYNKDVNVDKLSLQKEEVESVEWFDIVALCQACEPPRDEAFCVPTGGLNLVVGYLIENNTDKQRNNKSTKAGDI